MPRQPRLDLPGQLYHVIVRGVERRPIFRKDIDRIDFIQRLSQGITKTGSRCLTWALMSNHFHLLIRSGVHGVAALMHPLLTGYVGAFNRRYRRVGHLVQNRFKSILCEEEPYLIELLRYIPLNPVRAGIVKTPQELATYPWTGHSAMMGSMRQEWQSVQDALEPFGRQMGPARRAYLTSVIDAWDQGHRDDLEGGGLIRSLGGIGGVLDARASGNRQAFDERILGSGDFVERILREADQVDDRRQAFLHSGLTLTTIEKIISAMTGVEAQSLRKRDRRQAVADARALVIYAAAEFLGCPLKDLSAQLGLQSASISQARQRGQRLADKYPIAQTLSRYRSTEPVALSENSPENL